MTRQSGELIRKVSTRQQWVRFASHAARATLWASGVYAVLFLIARLTGLIVDVFEPWTVLCLPAIGLIVAAAMHRKVSSEAAARRIDERMKMKDLFLTAAMLERSPGEYRALVGDRAEEAAKTIRPATVVAYEWQRRTGNVLAALAVLTLATFLPFQLDPFGSRAQDQEIAERQRKTQAELARVAERTEALKAKPLDEALSADVDKMMKELEKQFNKMQPKKPELNERQLGDMQKQLEGQWRRRSAEELKRQSRQLLPQQIGGMDRELTDQWKKDLKEGKADSLKKEIEELREKLKELSETKDEQKKKELSREMQNRLGQLSEFMKNNGGTPSLNAALEQALAQLQQEGLDSEALDSMLELSELEMQQLAQSLRDMEELEDALEAIQWAKQLNLMEPLDGEACKECAGGGMSAYMEYYKMAMAGRCPGCGGKECEGGGACSGGGAGSGSGMRGPGIGQGGLAPEDPESQSAFKTEKSRSAMRAGKILLQWKTEGEALPGSAEVEYQQSVDEVKQGVSEAILQEKAPPDMHEAIRSYFDSVGEAQTSEEASPTPSPVPADQ